MKNKSCCASSKSSSHTNDCNRKYKQEKCCVDTSCDFGKTTLSMLLMFLTNGNNEGNTFPYVAAFNPNDPEEPIILNDRSQLVIGQTYYIVFNNSFVENNPNWTDFTYSFVYTENMSSTVYGWSSNNMLNEFMSLVNYIIEKINQLCIPCCIKQKITDNVITYVNSVLNPTDGAMLYEGVPVLDLYFANIANNIGQPKFESICDDGTVNSKCGPIYIANFTLPANFLNSGGIDVPSSTYVLTNIFNYTINFLNITQFYLKTYFSTKCCCSGSCDDECECDHTLKYSDACNFVFGRLCVINFNLAAFNGGPIGNLSRISNVDDVNNLLSKLKRQ